MKTKLLAIAIFTIAVSATTISLAQRMGTSYAEMLIGNRRFTMQPVILSKITASSRFNFFSLTHFSAPIRNDSKEQDYTHNSQLGYDLSNGLGVAGGVSFSPWAGFNPYIGGQYVSLAKNYSVVLAPNMYLNEHKNLEALAYLEFRPSISGNWGLYTRMQAMYNYSLKDSERERAYIYARLGVTYKYVTGGLAADLDWYGVGKTYRDNFGIFVRCVF